MYVLEFIVYNFAIYHITLQYKFLMSNISKNGEEHLKNFSSIKAMIKLAKMVEFNFFRTLEINQKLSAIRGAFI